MKKLVAGFLSLIMAVSLAACSSTATASSTAATGSAASTAAAAASSAAESKPLKLGVSVPNMTNVFFLQIKTAMEQEAVRTGSDEVIVMDAGGDQNKQMNDVADMINQGCNIIALSPINSTGVQATLEQCKDAGIPVICFNVGVDASSKPLVTSTIVSDNEGCGKLCADALGEALGGKGNVVEVTFSTTTTCHNRQIGFENEIAAKYPDIKILQSKDVEKATADYSQPVMVDFINANPDLNGVFCINDPTARGAIAALKEAGKIDSVKVVSVDGSDEGKAFIRTGEMVASAAQQPSLIGSKTVDTAYDILDGKTVEADQIIPVYIIDKTNVDAAASASPAATK